MKGLIIAAWLALAGLLLAVDGAAPDFSLKSLTGKTVKLSDYKGKVVVLNFWASWCPPCRREIPDFVKVHQAYRGEGVEFIGIAIDEKIEDIKKIVEQNRVEYPIVLGDEKVQSLYGGINAVPTTFFVNQEGRIIRKKIGAMNQEELEEIIKSLLKKGTGSVK
ncbi:MAG: TlpA family protein disulfide reductase [Candidatus Omnitrophica bacterium]|nr:TlpA family protein disulfide reductase [Candidatus Omnitrophota bacterium]